MQDASNLERLYDTHASGLFRYFLSFGGCAADAEDLLMELFARIASKSIPREAAKEKSFLFRSAHNLAIDRIRINSSRQATLQAVAIEPDPFYQSGHDPDATLFSTCLHEAFSHLPAEQLGIVQLKLWDELTFEQIGEVQGIPTNTAASRYRYAIEKLRDLLRPLYEEIQP